jgi:hypothetical protein
MNRIAPPEAQGITGVVVAMNFFGLAYSQIDMGAQ